MPQLFFLIDAIYCDVGSELEEAANAILNQQLSKLNAVSIYLYLPHSTML